LCNCPHCKELRKQQARHGNWQKRLLELKEKHVSDPSRIFHVDGIS
jgi:hypothetical protein